MRLIAILTILFTLCAPAILQAHHSVMRGYDTQSEVRIEGTIHATEWRNPHSRIVVLVKDHSGKTVRWTVETNAAETIDRLGPAAGFSRADFAIGKPVTIGGWKGRQGNRLFLTWAQFDDGHKVSWRSVQASKRDTQ